MRAGFTAAVSHELRTPLARLLSLLETATLPGEDVADLVDQARSEVEQIRELIDEVLFLSELESGARVVSLGAVAVKPELEAVVAELEERASARGVALAVEGDPGIELAIRPRMLRVRRAEPRGERDSLRRARARPSRSRSSARATRSSCAAPTTASASTRPS